MSVETENEFNPTKQNQLDLELKILNLKKERQTFVNRKISIESKLSKLQSQYEDVEYKSSEFNEIKLKRSEFKGIAAEIEIEIRAINNEIKVKNNLLQEVQHQLSSHKEKSDSVEKAISSLSRLRDHYRIFTKDKTRVASMRVMAAEFSDELDAVIKKI